MSHGPGHHIEHAEHASHAAHDDFDKKVTISITVVAVVTAAMAVVLITLNGISALVDKLYSPFDQDVTITLREGKTYPRDSLPLIGSQSRNNGVWNVQETG